MKPYNVIKRLYERANKMEMNTKEIMEITAKIKKMNQSKTGIRATSQENWNALAFCDVISGLCECVDDLEKQVKELRHLHYESGERI